MENKRISIEIKPKKSKSLVRKRRRPKTNNNDIKNNTQAQGDLIPEPKSSGIPTKNYFVVEKVSTNREVIKITQIDKDDNLIRHGSMKYDSPEKIKVRTGKYTAGNSKNATNATATPLIHTNQSQAENQMTELKLFSKAQSFHPTQTVYFSNQILKNNFNDSAMPKLNHNYNSESPSKEFKKQKSRELYPHGDNKPTSFSHARMKNFTDGEEGGIHRQVYNGEGLNYNYPNLSNSECQNSPSKGRRHRINVNKNAKFNKGNVKIQPIGNRMHLLNTNAVNITVDREGHIKPIFKKDPEFGGIDHKSISPNKAKYGCDLENENLIPHANYTQNNYFRRQQENLKRFTKSNSYSPNKNRQYKSKTGTCLNLQPTEIAQDDQFFYDVPSSSQDLNLTQQTVSAYSAIPRKNRQNRGLEKSEVSNKSFNRGEGSKPKTTTGFTYKSKVKKRLKFTMRPDSKQMSTKVSSKNAQNKMLEFNDIVSIVGINNISNLNSSHEVGYQTEGSPAKIVISKPQCMTRNSKNNTIENMRGSTNNSRKRKIQYNPPMYSQDMYYSHNNTQDIKSDCDSMVDSSGYKLIESCSPEKRPTGNLLQPPLMEKTLLTKTASELPGMKATHQGRTNSQTTNLLPPESLNMSSCLSESSCRMKSQHKMHKSRCTIITDCAGPRTCLATQTKRLSMKRRQEMAGKPLLIINFHGVLGCLESSNKHLNDICKPQKYYRKIQDEEVFIRQAATKNLKFLMGSFQIVLFLNKYCKKQDPLINIVESRTGDVFDAIYGKCSYRHDNKVIDYSQIYEDFGIGTEEIDDKVAVLCPLDMEPEEVKDRDREELLFVDDSQNYPYKNIVAECIPMNSNACRNPLAILFASMTNGASRVTSFARLTKFLNLMMNAFEEERSKSSNNSTDSEQEDDFSFFKGFKALQKLITQNNISTLKCALFSTNKISQAVNKQKAAEDQVLKFRSNKEKTYKTQLEREEIHKKFIEYNFHLAKTNSYINLKSQNVHTARHVNQYYNDFYYSQIEKEEEDINDRQNAGQSEIDSLLVQFQNFKFDEFTNMGSSRDRLYLNRFVALDHVAF